MSYAEFRDLEGDLRRFQLRLGVAGAVVVGAFALLTLRFVYLQLVQHEYYRTKAEDNRISIVPLAPNRGLIMDRNGVVLARNESQYTLEITPHKAGNLETLINELASVVEIQARDRSRFRKLRSEIKGAESLPIRTRLTDDEVARFAANAYRFPGVEIKGRLFRHYPMGEVASHALGYIGRISDKDLERLEAEGLQANYRGSDFIGKSGIEGRYERELHGVTGSAHVEIDASGRGIRTLESSPPTSGNNLTLTLDIKLQEVAERAFGKFRGALVVAKGREPGALLRGGGQERGWRPGTENLPGIVGFGRACELAMADADWWRRTAALRDRLEARLTRLAPAARVFGREVERLPNTTCITMPGVSNQTQLIEFDLAGIAVSTGSACSSGKVGPSHVLAAMGVEPEAAASAIRISLGWASTADEVDHLIDAWGRLYARTRHPLTDTLARPA